MITIEILNSPDRETIGLYEWNFNKVTLGSSQESLILIEDDSILPLHLIFEVTSEGELFVSSASNLAFYFINGAKLKGRYFYKNNSTLLVGNTSLRINNFSFNTYDHQKIMEDKLDQLPEGNVDLIQTLKLLEQSIIAAEHD